MDYDKVIHLDNKTIHSMTYSLFVLRKLYRFKDNGFTLHDYFDLREEVERLNDVLNEMVDKFLSGGNSGENISIE